MQLLKLISESNRAIEITDVKAREQIIQNNGIQVAVSIIQNKSPKSALDLIFES